MRTTAQRQRTGGRSSRRARFLLLVSFLILISFLINSSSSSSSSSSRSNINNNIIINTLSSFSTASTTSSSTETKTLNDDDDDVKEEISNDRAAATADSTDVDDDDADFGDLDNNHHHHHHNNNNNNSNKINSKNGSSGGSGGPKSTRLFRNMFKDGFSGDFIMTQQKYTKLPRNSPIRVAKYMSQCISDSPPRGCDLEAAKADPPRGRGWQRVARITKELLHEFPAVDSHFKGFRKYKTCSIVGNGGSLKLKKYGKYIDEAEAVIRFNGGPTTNGLSDYVGSKTTFRFLNTQHLGFHESKKEILLQHVTVEETMQKFVNFKKRFSGEIYVIDGDFHQLVLDTMEDGAASNGFYGLLFGLERCEKVTLWGFAKGWNKPSTGSIKLKYHYYDDVEPNESQLKRDELEAPKVANFVAKHANIFAYGEISY
jgi:hypothetical protein